MCPHAPRRFPADQRDFAVTAVVLSGAAGSMLAGLLIPAIVTQPSQMPLTFSWQAWQPSPLLRLLRLLRLPHPAPPPYAGGAAAGKSCALYLRADGWERAGGGSGSWWQRELVAAGAGGSGRLQLGRRRQRGGALHPARENAAEREASRSGGSVCAALPPSRAAAGRAHS